jgi:DNA-directed RNA polymerase sigma subunit (sigma70/sigma32)
MSDALNASKYDLMKVMSMQTYPVLLNAPVKSNLGSYKSSSEKTVGDLLPSLFKTPYDQSTGKDLRRDMETMMLANLNEVERDVLRLRLGLDDGRVKAVKEIGRKFHISWKEVRNVEKKALSKILDSREISEFVDAYNNV